MVGDANGDGVANAKDMAIVQQNLGKPGTRAQGDFDGNGVVDFKDLDTSTTTLEDIFVDLVGRAA